MTNAIVYFYVRGEVLEQYDEALITEARAVASVWRLQNEEPTIVESIVQEFPQLRLGQARGDFLQIVDREGRPLLQLPSPTGGTLQRVDLWFAPKRRMTYDLILPDGRRGRAVAIVADNPVGQVRALTLQQANHRLILAENRDELDDTLWHIIFLLGAVGIGLSTVSAVVILKVVDRELVPLDFFSKSVDQLDASSLAFRLPTDELTKELRPIASRLNDMLARLESAFSRERRFAENVAHELRTPLTELRVMAEVSSKWPLEPEALPNHHANVLAIAKRMGSIVSRLLTLNRSNMPVSDSRIEPTDLTSSLKAAWATHQGTAIARQLEVEYDMPDLCIVQTNADMLMSVLDNLMCNAVTYATPGSVISCRIAVSAANDSATLSLTNDSSDICDEDLPHLEEPFWRKESSRSSRERSGLGLSLVRRYADAMQVDCHYTRPTAQKFSVTITWPTRATQVVKLPG